MHVTIYILRYTSETICKGVVSSSSTLTRASSESSQRSYHAIDELKLVLNTELRWLVHSRSLVRRIRSIDKASRATILIITPKLRYQDITESNKEFDI